MQDEHKRIVIVDGYSTGRELVRELLARDVECLHLQSTEQIPAPVAKSFDRTSYDGDLGYLGDVTAAIEVLSTLRPDAVVAGSEWGVTFAERIAHGMRLPSNRIETLAARRDKFEMIEAARRHGLHVAAQASIDSLEVAHAWAQRHGSWPIVMKPMASAGSDGVTVCHRPCDIDDAFTNAFGRENFMGCINSRMLLQSFLPGPQFIVNTVSRGGRHYVTDVWSMIVSISGSRVVPGGIHLLDPTAPQSKALIAYTHGVLAALGIENGAHTELKLTPKGPALIETGARIMGAAMDEPSYAAAGMRTQANVFAGVLAGCERERRDPFADGHYRFRRHMTKLLFNFADDGWIRRTAGLRRLRELPSFHAHYRPLADGARVWRTADWLACGGVIYLVHDDPRQIAADIETVRRWERRNALYDVAPLTAVAA
jgi:biotin carboxylase